MIYLEASEMLDAFRIDKCRDASFGSLNQAGINSFENCQFCEKFEIDGISKIKRCLFLDRATFSGTTNISQSKFKGALIASGATSIKNSKVGKAQIAGRLKLEHLSADQISAKSREVFLKACKVDELVMNSTEKRERQIVHVSDRCTINRVLFEADFGQIRGDQHSKIFHIINGDVKLERAKGQRRSSFLKKAKTKFCDFGLKLFRPNSVIPTDIQIS